MTEGQSKSQQQQGSQSELRSRVEKLETTNPQFRQEIESLKEQLTVTTQIEAQVLQEIATRVMALEEQINTSGPGR